MSQKPSLVIVSSSNTQPKSLIKLITKAPSLDQQPQNVVSHSWTIDTKYYTAEIDIHGIDDKFDRTSNFNDSVEALIIHMDSNKEQGLSDLAKWSTLEEDSQPEVKLLLTNYCTDDTKVTKSQAIDWCLNKGFELIELYPTVTTPQDDIIKEKFGVDRVIEALQAHTWSNLVMKVKNAEDVSSLCDEFLTDDGMDEFSELFSQLNMMKNSIQSLPMNQRKQCAEQVVTAFWKAIGGDEEEIADI